jgi:hypothetical protein
MKFVTDHAIILTEETHCHCSKSSTINEKDYENQLIFLYGIPFNKSHSHGSMLYQPQAADVYVERNSILKPISVSSLTVKNFCILNCVTENLSYVHWGI